MLRVDLKETVICEQSLEGGEGGHRKECPPEPAAHAKSLRPRVLGPWAGERGGEDKIRDLSQRVQSVL